MIKYSDKASFKNQIFKTPFHNELDSNNRWVVLASIIPWDKMAVIFMKNMDHNMGRSTIDLRTVMGAIFIQYSLNLTDRNTIDTISENIYMQYFVGLSSFQTHAIFDHSLLPIFRQRLGEQGAKQLNEIMIEHAFDSKQIKHRKSRKSSEKDDDSSDNHGKDSLTKSNESKEFREPQIPDNRGTVKIDATVVPQNITYPTDTKMLNHSRELSEKIIDQIYRQTPHMWDVKPRTYRREARKKWLSFSKNRKPSKRKIRKQIKAQLSYLRRNLRHIDEMMEKLSGQKITLHLDEKLRKKMYVISEIYRQQKIMYDDKRNKIQDRIVSISQPWIRPIVRGKAGSNVEFGAKVNLSLTEKMVSVDYSSFDAFNEGKGFINQIEAYNDRFGYYPEFALADKIYLTRENRKYMKDKGIEHTGSPLGRPRQEEKKKTARLKKKNNERNHIEGKIGQGKLKFGLDKLRTKTISTSLCAINLIALAMNMLALKNSALRLKLIEIQSLANRILTKINQLRLLCSRFLFSKLTEHQKLELV